MKIYRRIRLSVAEIERLREALDDYIWIAIDIRRSIISAGDAYIGELRDVLLERRSFLGDIYCVGLNMATGELNFLRSFNRRNPAVGYNGEISTSVQMDIERQMKYFFGSLPVFVEEKRRENLSYRRIRYNAESASI